MKEDDSIDDFSAKLNNIVTRASGLGSTFDQQTLVRKLLSSVPKRIVPPPPNPQEKFRSSQDNKHDGKSKQFNNDRKPSHKFKKNNFQKGTKDSSKVKCYNCNKFGHVRRNCKQKDRGQEQSNLVQEDVEPTLLMAVQGKVDKGEEIFLNEKEIKPKKYISTDESLWYLDNGASNHMTGIRTHFKEIDKKFQEESVLVMDHINILSLGQLTENGCKIVMQNNILLLYGQDQKLLMRVKRSRNRLYKINLKVGMPKCLLANLENHAWLWHARLGHLNFDSIKQMTQKKLVEGIPSISHKNQVCSACLLGKHSRAPFPNQTNTKSLEPLNLVFGDLCGPISPTTESEKKYMFLLVEDCTRYMRVYFLKSKDEAFETFKEFKLKVENEVGKKLKSFRTDRGGEFISREFTRYCKENSILRQLTAPYSPQQNGIVERRNRIIDEVSTQDSERNDEDSAPSPMKNNTHSDMSDDDEFEQPIDNPSTPPPYTYEPNSEESTRYTSSTASSIRPFDHTPVQGYKNISEIYARAPEVQSDELLLLEEEPRNYKEVAQDKKWIKAMQIEIDSINKNKTWKLTTLPDK
ncbi:zinc finger, CCHC-type containing protein [Tanacetum coccineum]